MRLALFPISDRAQTLEQAPFQFNTAAVPYRFHIASHLHTSALMLPGTSARIPSRRALSGLGAVAAYTWPPEAATS